MAKYRIPEHLLLQTVKDEAVILDSKSGTYFTLNDVGTRMVQLYRDQGDMDTVVAGIVAEFNIDAATVRDDLQRLLQGMSEKGLAEPVDSGG